MGHLPNCITIGVAKCGTSALHNYLGLHPEISMSEPKELSFFSENRTWKNGVEWYKSYWPEDTPVRGESSPSYTYDPDWRQVPERIASVLGDDVKLLYIVRDPLDRIASHYQNIYRKRGDFRSFDEVISPEQVAHNVYVKDTRYYTFLSHYLNYFPEERIKVIILEELRREPTTVMEDLFTFLGVDPTFKVEAYSRPVNKSSKKRRRTDVAVFIQRLHHNLPLISKISTPPFLYRLAQRYLKQPVKRPQFTDYQANLVREVLAEEMQAFRALIGKDLAEWSI